MRRLFLIALIAFLFANNSFSQGLVLKAGSSFKNAKIKLTSGEIIKIKTLTVNTSQFTITTGNPPLTESINMGDVEEVIIPTRDYAKYGFLLGAVFGGVTLAIVKHFYEQDELVGTHVHRTYTPAGTVWETVTTPIFEKKELSPEASVLIVSGGLVAGTIIGYAIKGGWKRIYPSENKKVSLNLSFNNYSANDAMFNVQLRF